MNEESCTYGNAKLTLMKMWQNKKVDNKYVIQQLKLINQDIVTNTETSSSAQDMLNYLIDLPSQDVHLEIIQFLNDDQTSQKVLESIIDSYKNKIIRIIHSNGDLFQILPPWQQSEKIDKLLTIFQKICGELSKGVSKPFFLNVIIPALLDLETDNCLRDVILQIANVFLMNISIRDLTSCEFDKLTADTSTKYVVAIGKLREQNYADWHKLWIFLIRFWDRQLHSSMEIINKLLRIVEFAFRSLCHQQRIKGYDCWKELIDNASLEESYICSSKQIKLLVTPLRAKFSKQEVVICKRFDVFVHLLEKLQLNATLCLSDFLEFCFGPLTDNRDASKVGQGKSIPQLWSKSTKILMEIIGHSHIKGSDCLFTEDVIKFESPVITLPNFPRFYTVIIKAVGESCNLLKDANLEIRKEKVIMCMWKTVFSLIGSLPGSKIPYLEVVSQVFHNFLNVIHDHQYFEDLLLSILTVVVNLEQDFSCEVIKCLLKQLLTIFSRLKNIPSHLGDNFQQNIYKCFSNITLLEDKLHTMKIMMQKINETKISSDNCDNLGKIWLCLGDELVWDLSVEKIEEFENFGMFFMWPAYNLQQLDDHTRKQILTCWIKLYRKMTGEDDSKKLRVMNKLQNIFKSNPLHLFNLVSLLGAISQFENKFSKEFVLHLTEIISELLQLPFIKSEEDQKLSTILTQYFDSSFEFYQPENNEDIIRNISTCIKHLISARKYFKILETFFSFLKCASNDVITKYSKYLFQFLSNVSQQERDSKSYVSKEIQKILSFFNKDPDDEKKTFVVPSGRSARIANLAKNSPKSPKKRTEKATSSSTLRLFGKDLDTLSPLKVKGSQLHSSSKNRTKKAANASKPVNSTPLGEENSQDFVLIDSVVKFDPKKLNEHQKEVLRKRKDDIPALYQDLSQSSQDLFSSRSNSNSKDALGQQKKVIVEVIAPLQYADGGEAQDIPPIKENVSHMQNEKIIHDLSIEDSSKQETSNTDNDVSLKLTVPHQTNGKYVQDSSNISKSENLQTATEPEGGFLSCESDMFRTLSNKDLKSEDIFKESMTTVSRIPSDSNIQYGTEVILNDQPQNITPRESMTTVSHIPSDSNIQYGTEVILNDQPQNITPGESKSEDLFNSESQKIGDKAPSGSRKKKKNLELELSRLQLNIVGAETFTSTSRRTRPKDVKVKENNADHVKKSKGKLQKNENESESTKRPHTEFEKSSSISPTSKKSASVQKGDTSVYYKRRNAIGVVRELNFDKEPEINTDLKNPNESGKLESKSKAWKEVDIKNISEDKIIGDLKIRKNKQKSDHTDNNVTRNINVTKTQGNVTPRKRGRPPKLKPEQVEKSVRGQKRKHSSGDDDIIESSQESFGNVTTPLLNSSKKSKTDTSEDTTVVEQKLVTVINKGKEELSVKEVVENNIPEVPLDSSQTQDLPIDLNLFPNDLNASGQQSSLSSNDNFETEVEEKLKSTEDSTHTPNSTTNLSKETCDFSPISIQNVSESEQNLGKLNQENSQTELNTTNDPTLNTNTSQDTTRTQDSTTNISQESTQTQELVGHEEKKGTQETLTQPTQETADLCDEAEVCKPVIPYFDLPKKPQLTESEQFQCRMDTMSLCNDFNSLNELELVEGKKPLQALEQLEDQPATPIKNVISREKTCSNDDLLGTPSTSSIPSSPVTTETPKRTLELLNNTLDISPIASQNSNSSDEGTSESSAQIPLALKLETENIEDNIKKVEAKVDDHDNLNEVEEDAHKLEDNQEVETSSEENETVSLSDEGSLQDDENILIEIENDNLNGETKEVDNIAEDHSNNRGNIPRNIENISVNVSEPHFKPSTIQERSSKLLNMLNINSPKLFLKRQRLLGSSVSPSTGRIKRLMLNVNVKQNLNTHEEILEEDILTFKREIPSPLAVPRSSILKRKIVDTGDADGISPCPKRKRVNFSDPFITSRKIFIKDDCGSNLEAKRLFDGFSEQPDDDYLKDMFEPQDTQGITESENVETEPSLEILNPFMLRKDKPIYPKLIDCQDDVMVIVKKVTSPLFLNTLMTKLQIKKVRTVGDLAQMCEAEINRLPFKVPVVANVYKALENYYSKKWGKEVGETVVNGICDYNERRGAKVERKDVKTEMENLMSRAKEENVPLEELTKTIFSKMEFSQILSLFRTQQFPLKDIVQDYDIKDLLKYIVDNTGILKTFESLKQFGDPQSFSNAVVQFSTEEPLSDILKHRSIEDLQNVLKNTGIFNKEQLINDCLLPLINTPKDIDSYLLRLSVADICTIISDRTSDDITEILKSHIDSRNEEIKNDIMKKMFRYFDENLKPECLIDLHMKFLERIRCDLSERSKGEF